MMSTKRISNRFDNLGVVLDEYDNVQREYCTCLHSFHFPSVSLEAKFNSNNVNIIFIICTLLIALSTTIDVVSPLRLIIVFTNDCFVFVTFCILLTRCNIFIFWEVFGSFETYYKILNMFLARLIISFIFIRSNGYLNDPLAYIQSIVSITDNTLAIIIVSLMDGYAVDHKLKLVLIFLAVFHYCYDCLQLYFDTEAVQTRPDVLDVGGSVSEHTIAISTIISSIVFIMYQGWSISRKPKALILYSSYIILIPIQPITHDSGSIYSAPQTRTERLSTSLENESDINDDDVILYEDTITTATINTRQVTPMPTDLTYGDGDDENENANENENENENDRKERVNDNDNYNYNEMDVNSSITLWSSMQQSVAGLFLKDNKNEKYNKYDKYDKNSSKSKLRKSLISQLQLQREGQNVQNARKKRKKEKRKLIQNPYKMVTNYNKHNNYNVIKRKYIDIDDIQKRKHFYFVTKMDTTQTLLFMILFQLFGFSVMKSYKICQLLTHWKVLLVFIFFMFSTLCYIVFFGYTSVPMWLNIILLTINNVGFALLFTNVNHDHLMYHVQTFVFWWRVQNVVLINVSLFLIRIHNKIEFFDVNKEEYDYSQAIVLSILIFTGYIVVTMNIMLAHGFPLVDEKLKYCLIIIFIFWYCYLAIIYYFNNKYDYEILFFEKYFNINLIISCRTMVILKAFDMAVWFAAQLTDQIRFENGMPLYGKIEAKWINSAKANVDVINAKNEPQKNHTSKINIKTSKKEKDKEKDKLNQPLLVELV